MNWNLLILLVYPALLAVLFIGCRFYGPKKWNEEAFSLGHTKMLLGFIALCIMLHHAGQKTSASWIDRQYYVFGLDFFVPIGYVLVSFFTFLSGYGLYKSFKKKKDYLNKGFLLHRILPIVLTGYAAALIFFAVRLCQGEPMGGGGWILYLTGLKMANPNGWYVIVIPFFYLAFFLAFRFIKNEKAALLAVVLFTLAYQLIGTSIDHNDYLMCGEWWYNSIHLFSVGIFFAMHEERITAHLKKFFVLYLILGILLMLPLRIITQIAGAIFSYYGEFDGGPFVMPRRVICLITEILYSSNVVFVTFLFLLKIRIGNPFLKLMGSMTLEFYLIHGLFVELFCYSDEKIKSLYYIRNPFFFVLVIFVLALPSALLLKKSGDLLRKILGKESKG